MTTSTVKLAVVGSRSFTDYNVVATGIEAYVKEIGQPSCLISGGATGVDSLAALYAKANDLPITVFEAEWAKYGKSAGPRRNKQIVEAATHVLAFVADDSVGTRHTIGVAKLYERPLKIVFI